MAIYGFLVHFCSKNRVETSSSTVPLTTGHISASIITVEAQSINKSENIQ
jgi:hypothetical protein